jgi:hypothetical protein
MEIARRCGVGDTLVGSLRQSLPVKESEGSARTVPTKHGTTTQMNVSNIGKGRAPLGSIP